MYKGQHPEIHGTGGFDWDILGFSIAPKTFFSVPVQQKSLFSSLDDKNITFSPY